MIHELLNTGKRNATTGRVLADAIGGNIRQVTQQIERERRQGQPICASSDPENPGYYLAEDERELNDYCDMLKGRAIELFKTRQALVNVLKAVQEKRQQA